MLKPRQMSHLFITGSKNQMEPVIQELYRQNVFHIEEFVEQTMEGYEGVKIGTPLPGASEAASKLIRIRSIENTFGVKLEDVMPQKMVPVQQLRETIDTKLSAIVSEVEQIQAKKSTCEDAVKDLEQKINELKPFAAIPLPLEMYSGYQNIAVFTGRVSKSPDLIVPNETYFSHAKEGNFIAVFAPAEHSGKVQLSLLQANFAAVPVPKGEGVPQDLLNLYTEQVSAHKKEVVLIKEHLEAMKKEQIEFLAASEELMNADVDKAEAPLRFAMTSEAFLAEGWVPADRVDVLSDALVKVTGGKILVTVLPIDFEHDSVPVEYNNPSFSKPSQVLMDVYSRPTYTEVDPTLMISIVFPLFFGMIVGDVGYGLIFLAMSLGLRKYLKGEAGEQLLTVLRNASISSIFFGIVYSEFLGFAIPGWNPVLYSRHLMTEAGGHGPNIPELMVLSIWIGILHITLGRLLGMYNHAKQDHGHHRTLAVMANFGWLAVMWGIILAIWSSAVIPLMPNLTGLPVVVSVLNVGHIIGGVLILVGIILIARESILEVIELPTIVSHVLSYARLVAVGLSGVAIAMVVNYMSIEMFISPALENFTIMSIVMILVGLGIFLFGHTLNIALTLLGGGLHSIRLHYVEFFTKFYKGGGKKYIPFGMKRRFTED
ncbi:MAG: V-type ATP synthase subunit I [Methanoregula sp.]|nr:V-type ATP synthase subunit I [Methanoregula sp.]